MNPKLRHHSRDTIIFNREIIYSLLKNGQISAIFEALANCLPIQHAIGLSPGRTDGGTLARIEDTKLNPGVIGSGRHDAAESIYFLDQMPFSYPSNGRIAGHLAERFDVMGKQQRTAPRPSGSQGRFRTGVSTAHHYYIE